MRQMVIVRVSVGVWVVGNIELVVSLFCSFRSTVKANPRTAGWINGLHLSLSESLFLPNWIWGNPSEAYKGIQVRTTWPLSAAFWVLTYNAGYIKFLCSGNTGASAAVNSGASCGWKKREVVMNPLFFPLSLSLNWLRGSVSLYTSCTSDLA